MQPIPAWKLWSGFNLSKVQVKSRVYVFYCGNSSHELYNQIFKGNLKQQRALGTTALEVAAGEVRLPVLWLSFQVRDLRRMRTEKLGGSGLEYIVMLLDHLD